MGACASQNLAGGGYFLRIWSIRCFFLYSKVALVYQDSCATSARGSLRMSRESEFYRKHVSAAVDQRLVRNAALAVSVAQRLSRLFPDLEKDGTPAFRRLSFISETLFTSFPPEASAHRREHHGGNHVEIRSGRVILTSLTRATMPSSVDPQEYIKTIAESAQMNLPFDANAKVSEEELSLYGLIIFGGPHNALLPEFVHVAFPTPEGELAPGTIDLLTDHGSIVDIFRDREAADQVFFEFLRARRLFNST